MTEINKPGIYDNILEVIYHTDPCPEPSLSSSIAKVLFNRSPANAYQQHVRLGGGLDEKSRAHVDLGKVAHQVAIEGLTVEESVTFVKEDDWRKNVAKAARAEAEAANKVALLAKQEGQIRAMHSALIKSGAIPADIIHREVTMVWQENGFWIRVRPDIVVRTKSGKYHLYDFKSTGLVATPDGWGRNQIWEYAMQHGLYRRGAATLLGQPDIELDFIVQETEPPYVVSTMTFDDAGNEWTDHMAEAAIERWCDCMRTKQWPSYRRGIYILDTPHWIRERLEAEVYQGETREGGL